MSVKLLPVKEIEKIFKIKIKNKNLWLEAITHKSWLYFNPEYKFPDNERLEFLGDSILQTITSWYLYRNFSQLSEGEMSLIRASLVNRERLGEIGKNLGLEKVLLMSKKLDEKGKRTVLGNSLEALIGALFLDQGLEITKNFVEENILKEGPKIIKEKSYKDPKTILQEFFQTKYGKIPIYKLIEVSGPAHRQIFKVEVYLDNTKIGEGEGDSKQKAEFDAAQRILKEKIK